MLDQENNILIKPIGMVRSESVNRYETPRQGILAGSKISVIKLNSGFNFEQALKNLEGFERIWVIYWFHLNNNWKPMVTPPRHTRKKIGVFATRAPYRPNQIGISCVKLEKVGKLEIFISESDILDGSPVLDIKPYLPYSDSFPLASTGWVKSGIENIYKVIFQPKAHVQCEWLNNQARINLESFTRLQLEFNPTDASRKRISLLKSGNMKKESLVLAYRTWRIIYHVNERNKKVTVKEIRSGYTSDELNDTHKDKYNDKCLHEKFIDYFNCME
ncbi:MAG: tRNA (N6-threonylcarbamoyladenosine(37)-N6)-methyltransferase TrmO [Ignavibacteriaceae bacterium]|nr:tRNA (N6-threonylcarbamoyladenosine(37)-N6)-methyltransferase TrmO [Ignavibacteriaceae bacterium]